MSARRPSVFTIAPEAAFADALAAGLIDRTGGDRLALARAHVLLPSRRAVRALTEAFVRSAEGGLLLPRMTPLGDIDVDAKALIAPRAEAEIAFILKDSLNGPGVTAEDVMAATESIAP